MRYIFIFSFLFVFSFGCKKADNPTQPSTIVNTSTSVSSLKDGLLYTFTIPVNSFSIEDTLKGTFIILNQSSSSQVLVSGDSPIFQWSLKDSSGQSVMGMGPDHHLTYIDTLNPGASIAFTINNKFPNISGGFYSLDARLYSLNSIYPTLSLTIFLH
jgi:hypothetical protein